MVGEFSKIRKLDLSNNMIVEFPGFFSSLTTLEELFISHNRLKSLPVKIERSQKLRTLDAHVNFIDRLPTSIAELHYLTFVCY